MAGDAARPEMPTVIEQALLACADGDKSALKRIYDAEGTAGAFSKDQRAAIKQWLTYNSKYFTNDLYRLASELGAEDVGLFDLPGPRDILAVEWAARMRSYPWKRVVKVDITHAGTGDDHRRIEITR